MTLTLEDEGGTVSFNPITTEFPPVGRGVSRVPHHAHVGDLETYLKKDPCRTIPGYDGGGVPGGTEGSSEGSRGRRHMPRNESVSGSK